MAETMEPENAAFWLPTHFLTDDDFLSDDLHFRKPNLNTTNSNNFDLFSSSLDSPVSSTETERGDTNINDDAVTKDLDDDDFLAELTRHLAHSSLHDSKANSQKPWVFSTSPQSTLSGFGPWSNRSGFSSNGSPNGPSRVPSPPVTPPPKNDPAWDLLYEAAGQVARLKINALAAQLNHHHQQQQQNRGLLSAPRNVSLSSKPTHHHLNSFYDYPPQFEQVKRQGNGNFYCQHHNHHHHRRGCGGGPLGLAQSAWPALRPNHHRQPSTGPGTRPAFHNGPGVGHMPGVKRQSAGTGVFLPRRAGTTHQPAPPPEPRKKPNANNSPVLLPARVVQALNLDLEEMNNGVNPNANHHPRFGAGMLSDHDILVARRNAILEQQRRSLISRNEAAATMVGHEIRLPSDWTY